MRDPYLHDTRQVEKNLTADDADCADWSSSQNVLWKLTTEPCHPERSWSPATRGDGGVEEPVLRYCRRNPEGGGMTIPIQGGSTIDCPRTGGRGRAIAHAQKRSALSLVRTPRIGIGKGRILGILRLPLSRFASSESLRMTRVENVARAIVIGKNKNLAFFTFSLTPPRSSVLPSTCTSRKRATRSGAGTWSSACNLLSSPKCM